KHMWCAVPECTNERLNLEPKDPEYAYQNCRLCHLHFEEKWYKINKMRTRLHPDAIPTIFFGPDYGKSTSNDTKQDMKSSEDSPRKKKLHLKIVKLKAQNKTLCETIRRLRLKEKKNIQAKKETNEQKTLQKLGRKLLP
ncbi:hypothetical protein ALC60_10168, partial [Trachymyrmex zeteki]